MSAAVAIALSFESITCGSCGVAFAMTSAFIEARREDHKTFYCPNGCARRADPTRSDGFLKRLKHPRAFRG